MCLWLVPLGGGAGLFTFSVREPAGYRTSHHSSTPRVPRVLELIAQHDTLSGTTGSRSGWSRTSGSAPSHHRGGECRCLAIVLAPLHVTRRNHPLKVCFERLRSNSLFLHVRSPSEGLTRTATVQCDHLTSARRSEFSLTGRLSAALRVFAFPTCSRVRCTIFAPTA